jgi:hypothetical protein
MGFSEATGGPQVRLYSRPGNDLTHRFPLIVETLARLSETLVALAGSPAIQGVLGYKFSHGHSAIAILSRCSPRWSRRSVSVRFLTLL